MNKSAFGVLVIFKAFSVLPDEVSLADLTKAVKMPKVKVFRSLKTLQHAGFIEQNETNKCYRLAPEILSLSSKYLSGQNLISSSRIVLERLSDELNVDITLAVPDLNAGEIIFVDKIESSSRIYFYCGTGKRLPLHVGAAAKAILAYLPDPYFEKYLQATSLIKITDFTVNSVDMLREIRTEIIAKGYSVSDQEVDEGVSAVGACVFGLSGAPVAGLAVANLTSKMDAVMTKKIGLKLSDAAQKISVRLGALRRG